MMKHWTQAILANVAFVDKQTGKIIKALGKSKYAKNTYIFFTSDNGYHMAKTYISIKTVSGKNLVAFLIL